MPRRPLRLQAAAKSSQRRKSQAIRNPSWLPLLGARHLSFVERKKRRIKLSNRDFKILSILGLLFGVGVSYFGETGSCACPAQTVGQPAPFNPFQAEVEVGIVVVAVSMVRVVFSFRRKATSEAPYGTTL